MEARVPFLDHELVELVFTVPPEIRTRKSDPKYLLREIVRDLLPHELINAPKRGFILPLPLWTRNELKTRIKEMLSPDTLKAQGLLATSVWKKIVKPHLEGRRDYTQQVWTLFMFQMWYNSFLS